MVRVISTALTLCSVVVIVRGRWPNPAKDPLVYIANPIESEMPGHWVPASIIKVILEKDSHTTYRPIIMNLLDKTAASEKRATTATKSRHFVDCKFYMIGFYKGCMQEDGYDPASYWRGTFPPFFNPDYNPQTHQRKPYSTVSVKTATDFYESTTEATGDHHMNEATDQEAAYIENGSASDPVHGTYEEPTHDDDEENVGNEENDDYENNDNEDATTEVTEDLLPETTTIKKTPRKPSRDSHYNSPV